MLSFCFGCLMGDIFFCINDFKKIEVVQQSFQYIMGNLFMFV